MADDLNRLSRCLCAAALFLPGVAMAQDVVVPSGQPVQWIETLRDLQGPSGLTLRFRFVAPELGTPQAVSQDQLEADMQALCDGYALPRVAATGPQPAQIVISLSSKVIPFGESDATVAQFFDAYSIVDGVCSWDMF
ncbi:MAG TPA: DUF6497 family protein [Paenirhodobacter sp.]